jgi:hypothetical protein
MLAGRRQRRLHVGRRPSATPGGPEATRSGNPPSQSPMAPLDVGGTEHCPVRTLPLSVETPAL